MLSCVMDKIHNCKFSATNIYRAFLNTDMEGMLQVRLYGALAEILLKIDPEKYGNKVVI